MKAKELSHLLALVVACLLISCTSTDKEDIIEGHELYRIQVGGKCGFMNEYGKLVIEPQFDRAYWYFTDSVCYAEVGDRRGLINTNGDFMVELDTAVNCIFGFANGMAPFLSKNQKEGIISKTGEIILPTIYKNIILDGENGFIVEDTLGNQGYVNNQGDFIVPCKYDAVNGFNEGLMVVATSDKCGYVDTTGAWVINPVYDDARAFGDGLARVKIDGKWNFIDHEGKDVDGFVFEEILSGFNSNRAFVKNGNNIELIDRKGKKIANIEADSVYGFHDGYATFKKNERFGKVDTLGTVVVQPKYEKLYWTIDGLSVFEKNGKQGVLDMTGKTIVEALHEVVSACFDNSQLLLGVDDNWNRGTTYYDRKGNLIWKDTQGTTFSWPKKPTKDDFVRYFDSRLSDLDPIEGIYYVTTNKMAVNRDNDHATSNGSSSVFYAVMRKANTNEFIAQVIDEQSSWSYWVKKFVQIGGSNAYAVVNNTDLKDPNNKWAEDGKLILDDPYKFQVTLRQGGNNYYNWYVECEFIKDYPTATEYEQVQKAEWTGTGFAIADGYVVTNYHVTNGAKTIRIKGVNGEMEESYKGYVVASDREHDISIIRILDKKFDGLEDDIPYSIGKGLPEVGEKIFVLGYPMTDTMGKEIKLTDGIISAESGFKGDQSMYQISAAVQPGNSGGPLFDNESNVIGIVRAKHADAENANYAIKVSYLLSLIKSSDLGIKVPDQNNVKSKSLSNKVKQVKPFVYLIECSSH